jgi:hypothetical protein
MEVDWVLMKVMKGIGVFYYWTWFLWPFMFVFSLIDAISSAIKDENPSEKSKIIAAVSLLVILAGINGLNF